MAGRLTQYRVFIGSPQGVEKERECFRSTLRKYTELNAEPRAVVFHPVGWEQTPGGVGRPQELINEDLRRCDYAVFVFRDRWGSPSGDGDASRTEAELELAEQLYKDKKLRNIIIFFKKVNRRQMQDPGEQLKRVIDFKKRLEKEEGYLFKEYSSNKQFAEILETNLATWLRDHEIIESNINKSLSREVSFGPNEFMTGATIHSAGGSTIVTPNFNYWIAEAITLSEAPDPDYANVLFCARKATAAAAPILNGR